MSRSEELIDQYRQIHASKSYGSTSEYQLGHVHRVAQSMPKLETILDYGCGRSRLVDWLAKLNDAEAYRYDPAIPEFSEMPIKNADLVLNTDVMEHVPEEAVDDVISKIRKVSKNAFFNISVQPALEILPNGENAHCTVKPMQWWAKQIVKHFNHIELVRSYSGSSVSFVTWPTK